MQDLPEELQEQETEVTFHRHEERKKHNKDDYAAVANYIRTKKRFALLKSVLISLRGVRGKQRKDAALPTSAVDFGFWFVMPTRPIDLLLCV